MNWNAVRKRLQRQSFDLLTQRHGLLVIFLSLVVMFVTLVNFGESLTSWSAEKYAAVMNSFRDNVVGQSFRDRLCLPLPIDIVYTWVNGSDPLLLQQLRDYKQSVSNNAETTPNGTEMSVCRYDNCIFANGLVIDPPVPPTISLRHLGLLYPAFKDAKTMVEDVDLVTGHNVTLIFFETKDVAETALSQRVVMRERTANVRKLFYTTEKGLRNTLLAQNVVIMIGFPDELNDEQLIAAFPQEHRSGIAELTVHKDKGIAALTTVDNAASNAIVRSQNISISGKSPTFKEASFVWDLTDYRHSDDISASRFEDNDELRYSLRSVEKHAPWIRHIFIVTNGQIPSWLNLDDERVTVVSHSQIFPDKSHLPTFSSPAIESHLHRIPGLSEWFIYMNDDVLFGRDVWPDDFVTASGAQKVYLTWPVPNCNDGCPASWISDGYCDRACNNSQCEWDGGDCTGTGGRAQYPLYGLSGGAQSGGHLPRSTPDLYCNQGCANNWIADRYCDQSCNVRACGFDAADCGTSSFTELRGVVLHRDVKHYDAKGTDVVYFNLTNLLAGESDTINSATFSQDAIVRSASLARKFNVVTVVLYNNETQRMLNFSLLVKDDSGKNFTYNFTVTVDTLHIVEATAYDVQKHSHPANATEVAKTEPAESFAFIWSPSRKFPKPKHGAAFDDFMHAAQLENITEHDIPVDGKDEYNSLVQQLESDELTQIGFNAMLVAVMKKYAQPTESVSHVVVSDQFKSRNPSHVTGVQFAARKRSATQLFDRQNKTILGSLNYKFDREDRPLGRRLNYNSNLLEPTEDDDTDSRSLHTVQGQQIVPDKYTGFLPWEKHNVFPETYIPQDKVARLYKTSSRAVKRHLLDTYADSLRHVSRIYNRAYGYTARRVPGHMPHMINRHIAAAMQDKFVEEWDWTSSHRIRHSDDMQFAFSYYYYLMSEPVNSTIDDVFSEIDIDKSGVLSDREVRILATRIYDLPIDLQTLEGLERTIMNCSLYSEENSTATLNAKPTSSQPELYYDKRMPQVTLDLVKNCPAISDALKKLLKSRTKYEFEVLGEDNIMFKMLNANVSRIVAILDEVRQQPRKFICLNDNIDYEQSSAKTVKAVLRDFYESLLPKPSRFELSSAYRNKFLHVHELHEWWYYRMWLRRFAIGCLFVAVTFTLVSFYCNRASPLRRRWSHR